MFAEGLSGQIAFRIDGEISTIRVADLPGRGKSYFCEHAIIAANLLINKDLRAVIFDFKGQGSFDWLQSRFPGRVRVANIRKGVDSRARQILEDLKEEFGKGVSWPCIVLVDEAHQGLITTSKPSNDFEKFCNDLTIMAKDISQMGRSEKWILVAVTLSPAKTAADIVDNSIGMFICGLVSEPELRKRIPGNPQLLLDERLTRNDYFCISYEGQSQVVKYKVW